MRPYTLIIPAGAEDGLDVVGDYVRVKSAAVPVVVRCIDTGERVELEAGDSATLSKFSKLRVSHDSGTAQAVTIYVGNGTSANSSKVGGSVTSKPTTGAAVSHAQGTVTNASGQIRPANSERVYLLIQNRDAAGAIYVNLNGVAATAANGIKIPPGGYYETNAAWCPVGVITAIGDIASNANVLILEA